MFTLSTGRCWGKILDKEELHSPSVEARSPAPGTKRWSTLAVAMTFGAWITLSLEIFVLTVEQNWDPVHDLTTGHLNLAAWGKAMVFFIGGVLAALTNLKATEQAASRATHQPVSIIANIFNSPPSEKSETSEKQSSEERLDEGRAPGGAQEAEDRDDYERIDTRIESLEKKLLDEYKKSEALKKQKGDLEREAYIRNLVASDKDKTIETLTVSLAASEASVVNLAAQLKSEESAKAGVSNTLAATQAKLTSSQSLLDEAEDILNDLTKIGEKLARRRRVPNVVDPPAA